MAWDPKTYLSFGAERTRPAAELLARIPIKSALRVADLGCGPGNSTALLRAHWPEAEIDGIDSSAEMLKEAHASGLDARLIEADIARWEPESPYDVIYSNAALQWLGNHDTLFPRLLAFLRPGGVLAVICTVLQGCRAPEDTPRSMRSTAVEPGSFATPPAPSGR